MKYLLKIEFGDQAGEELVIEEGEAVIGRLPTVDFVIRDSHVSRRHIRLVRTGDEVVVENLSRFGTLLDGRLLNRPEILVSGQRLEVPRAATMLFQQEAGAGDKAPVGEQEADFYEEKTIVIDMASAREADAGAVADEEGDGDSSESDVSDTTYIQSQAAQAVRRRKQKRRLRLPFATHVLTALLVAGILVPLKLLVPQNTWTYAFVFERSPVQWVTLTVFVFGLVLLMGRNIKHAMECRALRLLRDGRLEKRRLRMVSLRFRRLHARLKRSKDPGIWSYAKELAERDAGDLEASHGTLTSVIQVLPLIGFFGTVLGLSQGLYKSFVLSDGGSSTAVFGQSIGTAFDTTLLALACTIVVIIGQRLLRQKEERLLMRLDAFVDDYIEDSVPTETKEERTVLPTPVLDRLESDLSAVWERVASEAMSSFAGVNGFMRQSVDSLSDVMKKQAGESTAALRDRLATVCQESSKGFKEDVASTAERILASIAERQDDGYARMVEGLGERFDQSVKAALAEAWARPEIAESVAAALRQHVEEFRVEIAKLREKDEANAQMIRDAILRQPGRGSIADAPSSVTASEPGEGSDAVTIPGI